MKLFKSLSIALLRNQKVAFWTFLIMLILPNVAMFFTEPQPALTRLCSIVLPLSVYWVVLTLPRKPGWAFWWLFLFVFFDAFEIVLLYLFGESPIAVDMFLNVVTSNVTEVDELLGNLLIAIAVVVVIYVLGMVMAIASLRNREELGAQFRAKQRLRALCLLIVAVVLTGSRYIASPGFRVENDIFPVNVCYNLYLAVDRSIKTDHYAQTSKNFHFNAHSERNDSLPEIYVIVVGETARAENFGIYGYDRPTTPQLASTKGITKFTDALTMSNTTHKSVPMLLSDIGSVPFDSIYYRKGIISAFAEAGYQTAFYSNQRRNGSFIDFFGLEAQEAKFIKDGLPMKANPHDGQLVQLVENRLNRYHGGKLLIVVHCYGSHFNYQDRYPKSVQFFTPDTVEAARPKWRQNLINSYDNTIAYTDYVVAAIIRAVASKQVTAAVAYTSDHGEDIYDDSRNKFLHASPCPTGHQLWVPFLIWTSDQYRRNYPEKCQQLARHSHMPVSTNMVLFHTMLDMAGINTPYLKREYATASPAFRPHKRLYVNDHNQMMDLEHVGLRQVDIDWMRSRHLQFP